MKLMCKIQSNQRFKVIFQALICIFAFLYIFSLPSFSGRPIYQYVSYGLMVIFGGLTFIYTILYKVYKNMRYRFVMLSIPIFVVWAFISTLVFSHQFRSWLTLLLLLFSFIVFYFSFACISNVRLVIKIFVIAFLAFSAYFIFHYRSDFIHIKSIGTKRLGDFFDNVNAIGGYMSIAFCLCLYILIFFNKKREIAYAIPLFILFLVGISTGSRAFFIVSIIAVFLCLFLKFKKNKWILIIFSLAFMFLVIALFKFSFMETIKNRLVSMLTTFEGTDAEKSSVTRALWQKYAFYLGLKNPILGYGSFGFTFYSGVGTYSHGNLGEVFCNFGVVGVVTFYAIPVWSFLRCLTWKNNFKVVAIITFVYYALTSFMTVNYFHKDTYVIFALVLYIASEINTASAIFQKRKERALI